MSKIRNFIGNELGTVDIPITREHKSSFHIKNILN